MSEDLDPRLHPLRDDLAGAELKGRVERPRFAEALVLRAARAFEAVRPFPHPHPLLAASIEAIAQGRDAVS